MKSLLFYSTLLIPPHPCCLCLHFKDKKRNHVSSKLKLQVQPRSTESCDKLKRYRNYIVVLRTSHLKRNTCRAQLGHVRTQVPMLCQHRRHRHAPCTRTMYVTRTTYVHAAPSPHVHNPLHWSGLSGFCLRFEDIQHSNKETNPVKYESRPVCNLHVRFNLVFDGDNVHVLCNG